MTNLVQLLTDIAAMIDSCTSVQLELGGAMGAVTPYLDEATGDMNSVTNVRYRQPNGTILVTWEASRIAEGELSGWAHFVEIYCRAMRQKSQLRLLNAVIDGVPLGDSERWRYLCVNEDVDPVQIEDVARATDEEGIDYYVIRCIFREKSDEPYTP